MGWSIGFDSNWNRDIGYGVPAICDHPKCHEKIDRGLSYVCGGDVYGELYGCGLFFCDRHRDYAGKKKGYVQICKRCSTYKKPYSPKPDTDIWIKHKLNHSSWGAWRKENVEQVEEMKKQLKQRKEK